MTQPEPASRFRLSVVAPCFNEAPGVEAFYRELTRCLDAIEGLDAELVFVDDGSTDGTLEVLNRLAAADARVRVYALSRNFGGQAAFTAGLDVATGDAVVMMDSDLQHPPSLIPVMIEKWRAGCHVVSAQRSRSDSATLFKRFSSWLFYRLINLLSDMPITPRATDFTLLDRKAVDAIRRMPERHRFMRGLIAWVGFNRAYVEFEAGPRVAGVTKYSFSRLLNLALDAVVSFSGEPLRLAARVGLVIVGLGFIYLLYILIKYFTVGVETPGWSSLASLILILGGMQMVFIGLMGEYLARVFEQSKGRPIYLFKQTPDDAPPEDSGPVNR